MELDELAIIDLEIERRRKFEPLRFFRPNGAQERFIKAITEPDARVIVFSAANWIGKTASAIATLGALMWPEMAEAECFQDKLFKDWTSFGFVKRARIVSTPKELESIGSVQSEIRKWWSVNRYKGDKMGKTYPSQFTTDTGWTVDLMTYDMSPEQFEGATISLFIFNEPCPEPIYDACLARMKVSGRVLMPMTPLTNSAWIYDRLVANENKANGVRVIYGATEENCCEHGRGGVIPHAAIAHLEANCDPDDREARLHGKFLHLAGQIFKSFSRDIHTFKLGDLHDFLPGKETYMVCDPAIGKPLACIWAAVDATGTIWVYDEYPNTAFQGAKDSNLTVTEYAELFKTKEEHRPIGTRILDRHFGNVRRTLGGLTLKQEFGEVGIDFIDSYSVGDAGSEVETGILKVKDLLRFKKDKPLDALNRPRIMVADHCINTIHALERWSRDEKTGKPKEEYKDFADCLRYLAMANPEIEPDRPWDLKPAHYGVGN